MDEMTLVKAVRECSWKEEVTYGDKVLAVLPANDMKNWMSHMLDVVSSVRF